LVIEPGRIRLTTDPKEHHTRPAADPLFRSAAIHYGPRVVGVILTGGSGDGTAGAIAIKRTGGVVMVQDPAEATAPTMPCRAEIARLLVQLSKTPIGARAVAPDPPPSPCGPVRRND
jgi:two-component system chemotaxis response regulator CheB